MKKQLLPIGLVLALITLAPPVSTASSTEGVSATTVNQGVYTKVSDLVYSTQSPIKLTLQQAVYQALGNNLDLKLMSNAVSSYELDRDKADYYSDKQKDADSAVKDGWDEYSSSLAQLNQAKPLLSQEVYDAKKAELDQAAAKLQAADTYRVDTLQEAQIAWLLTEKGKAGYEIASLKDELSKKQISLLTQKSYYDVLNANRLVKVKTSALNRAKSQATLAKQGFEQGMRAKDDWLMAQAQVDLMQADQENARITQFKAESELLKVLNLPGSVKIECVDDFTTVPLAIDVNKAVYKGLSSRFEIRKAQMELNVAKLNTELASRYSGPGSFDYRGAKLAQDKAEIELTEQQQFVEADIRQAAMAVNSTKAMLGYIQTSVKNAQKSLDIATLRYREGYSLPSSVMKNLHSEDAAGTTLEVLASQEKLAEIEEKVTNIIYNYNLARANYLLSTGDEE